MDHVSLYKIQSSPLFNRHRTQTWENYNQCTRCFTGLI